MQWIAWQRRQTVYLNDKATGESTQKTLRNTAHTGGPAPRPLFVFVKAFAKRRMRVRYLDPQMIIAQNETLYADAKGTPVARQQLQLGGDAATRGEPHLLHRRIELEGVAAISDRLHPNDCSIGDQMEVRVGAGRMTERCCPLN